MFLCMYVPVPNVDPLDNSGLATIASQLFNPIYVCTYAHTENYVYTYILGVCSYYYRNLNYQALKLRSIL